MVVSCSLMTVNDAGQAAVQRPFRDAQNEYDALATQALRGLSYTAG
jgi:hypothetical protein